jgi:hypothetical protein
MATQTFIVIDVSKLGNLYAEPPIAWLARPIIFRDMVKKKHQ